MSLLSAIPGLSRHETRVPPAMPETFDRDKALRLLRDGMSMINSFYPPGAMEWLREKRPDVVKQLKADVADIEKAIMGEEISKVALSVETCIKHHRKAFEIFEARPPVMEVQGDLLAA